MRLGKGAGVAAALYKSRAGLSTDTIGPLDRMQFSGLQSACPGEMAAQVRSASISCRSAGVRRQSAALTLSNTCWSLVAPEITEHTCG